MGDRAHTGDAVRRGDRLEGKVAIVVGAGQTSGDTIGNGRAAAILFAREGATVLAVDRDVNSATETVRLIEAEGGVASAFAADVTRAGDCQAMVETCVRLRGRVDVLLNNVGIGGPGGPVELAEDDWDRTPLLAYSASKGGVNSLTRSIAMQYAARGIRANAIMPGLIRTPMAVDDVVRRFGVDRDALVRMRDKAVPMQHMGEAWDVAYAALFLASDEARYVTGVVLPVDGGLSCKG